MKENKYKNNKIKSFNNHLYLIISLVIFINLTFIDITFSKVKLYYLKSLNLDSEITMTLIGSGEQRILSRHYAGENPDEIYVNNIYNNESSRIVYNLNKSENIIKMVWYSPVTTCNGMFANLFNIIEINLSNFDASLVTDMNLMFNGCHSLTSVNFNNINSSKVETAFRMFYDCRSLISLDLSQFDSSSLIEMSSMFEDCISLKYLNINYLNTSSVLSMGYIFENCISLTSLDLSNFDTSSVYEMAGMFYQCESLISLNLQNFNTSNVYTFQEMFFGCKSLLSLDLSNFNISEAMYIYEMFYNCSSLIYLNLKSFIEGEYIEIEDIETLYMFNNINPKMVLCLDIDNNPIIKQALEISNISNNNNCQDICFLDNIKISPHFQECITDCIYTNNTELYEYNNICYSECPENTYISPNNPNLCLKILNCEKYNKYYNYEKTSCINSIPQGYYVNDDINKTIDKCHSYCKECSKESNELNLCISCNDGYYPKIDDKPNNKSFINCYKDPVGYYLDDDIYKPCYNTCKNCSEYGDEIDNKCIECIDGYSKIENNNNCYENCQYYYYIDESNKYQCTSEEKCPIEQNKIIKEKKKCINNCNDDDTYKCEFNNICYESCPEDSNISDEIYNSDEKDDSYEIKKTDEMNESNKIIMSDEINKSNEAEKSENVNNSDENKSEMGGESDDINRTDDLDEINKSDKINKSNEINKSNGINKSDEINKSNEIIKSNLIYNSDKTDNNNIEKECPKDMPYKNQNNECTKECNATNFFNEICKISNNNPITQQDIIKNIKEQLSNGDLDSLLIGLTEGQKKDLLIKSKDITFQITTTDNQNNNNYTDISRIKLGECENLLKKQYKIDENKTLLIFKIDYYIPGLSIPVIGYEVYHPDSKIKLDLKTYCKDILIDFDIPASVDEDNLYKYDPNSEYYTNECVPSTSDNGTDIILNDRKEEFINNNLSLCENKCTYNGYNEDSKTSSCECEIKAKEFIITELFGQENILSNNITYKNSSSNVATMKCVNTLFTKDGLLTNIGSYVLLVIVVSYIILIVLYFKFGMYLIEKDIKKIINQKRKNKNKFDIFKVDQKGRKKKKKNEKSNVGNPVKKKKKTKIETKINNKITNYSKIELKNTNILINIGKDQSSHLEIFKSRNKNININNIKNIKNINSLQFYDSELNSLSYRLALIFDKRTYINYYISLIKTKHPLIFSFFPNTDYNIIILKISILLLSFAIYFAINTLFFNDSVIHEIYENEGKYNISSQIPKIIYSFIISHIICMLLKYFSLPEKQLLILKYETTLKNVNYEADKVNRCFFIKYIIFYIVGLLFLILFWYYLSSFCAVFQNSQKYPFINTLICVFFSFIYPLFINLLPGIFRMHSLNKETNRECLYKFSKAIQYI